jgi:hypothetical protein
MKSSDYKTQFMALLYSEYPQGLPPNTKCKITLYLGNSTFDFPFDGEDFEKYVAKMNGKRRKPIIADMASDEDWDWLFDRMITPSDVKFLKQVRISLEDVEKSEQQR